MTVSRRQFVEGSVAAMAAGRIAGTPDASREARTSAAEDLIIDALSATAVGPDAWEQIRQSKITALSQTVGPAGDPPFSYEAAVRDLAEWHGMFDRYRDRLIHLRRAEDVLTAQRDGRLAVMLNFQNGTHLARDLRNVEFFYNLGIRQIQLTYNDLNDLGAGCTERVDPGLSDFGIQVVEKMNGLGMLVDLSHCGVRTTLDGIEASKGPVLITHSNCRALSDNPRCKTDEQIKKLAAKGGVMGISTVNFFVSRKERSSTDDVIAHIEYVAKLVGIDHVGLGTDSSIQGWRAQFPTEKVFWDFHGQFHYKPEANVHWPPFIEELDVPEKLVIIRQRLAARGFSAPDIAKVMGGNFLRVYREVLG